MIDQVILLLHKNLNTLGIMTLVWHKRKHLAEMCFNTHGKFHLVEITVELRDSNNGHKQAMPGFTVSKHVLIWGSKKKVQVMQYSICRIVSMNKNTYHIFVYIDMVYIFEFYLHMEQTVAKHVYSIKCSWSHKMRVKYQQQQRLWYQPSVMASLLKSPTIRPLIHKIY